MYPVHTNPFVVGRIGLYSQPATSTCALYNICRPVAQLKPGHLIYLKSVRHTVHQPNKTGVNNKISSSLYSTHAQSRARPHSYTNGGHIISHQYTSAHTMVKYLSQQEAIDVDVQLMGPEYAYSIDQLTELAGLSVACSVQEQYPLEEMKRKAILVCCGPGNNGGDGLVAARHLKLFGYKVTVYYPKRKDVSLYKNLTTQCEQMNVTVLFDLPPLTEDAYGLLIDALFGFSFKGEPREPYKSALQNMINSSIDICSVDIPSGWDVEKGNQSIKLDLKPKMLISLTAPKLCAKNFLGVHYLGGRFVPPALEKSFNLNLPAYSNTNMCVKLH